MSQRSENLEELICLDGRTQQNQRGVTSLVEGAVGYGVHGLIFAAGGILTAYLFGSNYFSETDEIGVLSYGVGALIGLGVRLRKRMLRRKTTIYSNGDVIRVDHKGKNVLELEITEDTNLEVSALDKNKSSVRADHTYLGTGLSEDCKKLKELDCKVRVISEHPSHFTRLRGFYANALVSAFFLYMFGSVIPTFVQQGKKDAVLVNRDMCALHDSAEIESDLEDFLGRRVGTSLDESYAISAIRHQRNGDESFSIDPSNYAIGAAIGPDIYIVPARWSVPGKLRELDQTDGGTTNFDFGITTTSYVERFTENGSVITEIRKILAADDDIALVVTYDYDTMPPVAEDQDDTTGDSQHYFSLHRKGTYGANLATIKLDFSGLAFSKVELPEFPTGHFLRSKYSVREGSLITDDSGSIRGMLSNGARYGEGSLVTPQQIRDLTQRAIDELSTCHK